MVTPIPGFTEARLAAEDAIGKRFNTYWVDEVALAAVTAAAPIIVEALAKAAETMPFNERLWQTHERNDVARWLRGFLKEETDGAD